MKKETEITHLGRNPENNFGTVGVPLYQTSTVLFPDFSAYHNSDKDNYYTHGFKGTTYDYSYGIGGTQTTFALQDTLKKLEKGEECLITPSGLSAITTTLLALLESGDHILVTDSVYGPTRRFCTKELKKYGIETEFYDPYIGPDIKKLIRKNTKLIFLESPGSLTFEVQDVPAIGQVAKEAGVVTVIDNSWATPLYFSPLTYGIDISIQAITKYIGGHSDILLGAIICRQKNDSALVEKLLATYKNLGINASPNDCWLALRGIRSMAARMEKQYKSALEITKWLQKNPAVKKVIYPALEDDQNYELWKKQFSGAASLISVVLNKKYDYAQLDKFARALKLFKVGASWGGYESLIMDFIPPRTAVKWPETATCLRFYVGLEEAKDLESDLSNAFELL